MLCQHCGRHPRNRPRGLCWSCYYRPGVREQYPSTSKFAYRGVSDFNGGAALPTGPTSALPGTPEKVAILAERARLRARNEEWRGASGTEEAARPRKGRVFYCAAMRLTISVA
jgi:hypothetical protein